MTSPPVARSLRALGGVVSVQASGEGAVAGVDEAVAIIGELHQRLTRFEPGSELCILNKDPRAVVPASPIMLRFAEAVGYAGRTSGGLVDATCLGAVERAGYMDSIDPDRKAPGSTGFASLADLDPGEMRVIGGDDPESRWREVCVVRGTDTVVRPPGVRLDSGGIGKGLAADLASERLSELESFAVECMGDLRVGGTKGTDREILVAAPSGDGEPVARLHLSDGAAATSGITRRSWLDSDGRPAHHLINPRTGRPAFTGVVQVTAIAPTAVEAEVRAKSALLSGPDSAAEWLIHGGVVVTDSGNVQTVVAKRDREPVTA